MGISCKRNMVVSILFFAIITLIIAYFVFGKYLGIAWLQERSQTMKAWADTHFFCAVVWYMLANCALVIGCVPAIPVMALLGGFLFGPIYGTIFATLSSTIGATASYVLFKYAMFDIVHARYGKRLEYLLHKLHYYGASYLLVMHFMTIVPYCLINMVAVLADISWWIFFWTTIGGSLPTFAIYAFAGQHLATIKSMGEVFSWQSIALLGALIVLALVPILIKKWQSKKK